MIAEDEMEPTNEQIERVARMLAWANIMGFREAAGLYRGLITWPTTIEDSVDSIWESFCGEAVDCLMGPPNKEFNKN